MKRPKAPCKDCDSRFVGCHIVCDKYLRFTHDMELFREEKYRIAEENRIQNEIESRRKKMAATGQMYRKKKQ